jgi:hypothetical protein
MGVYLTGVRLMGVHLMGVHLVGVHLVGVHPTGVYLIGVYLIRGTVYAIFPSCFNASGAYRIATLANPLGSP